MADRGSYDFLREWIGNIAGNSLSERNIVFQVVDADPPLAQRTVGDVWFHTPSSEWRCWDGVTVDSFKGGGGGGPAGTYSVVQVPAGPPVGSLYAASPAETVVVEQSIATDPGHVIDLPAGATLGDEVTIINFLNGGFGIDIIAAANGGDQVVSDSRLGGAAGPTAQILGGWSQVYVYFDATTMGGPNGVWFPKAGI